MQVNVYDEKYWHCLFFVSIDYSDSKTGAKYYNEIIEFCKESFSGKYAFGIKSADTDIFPSDKDIIYLDIYLLEKNDAMAFKMRFGDYSEINLIV